MNARWEDGTKRLGTVYQEKILIILMESPSWLDIHVLSQMRDDQGLAMVRVTFWSRHNTRGLSPQCIRGYEHYTSQSHWIRIIE